MKNLVFLLITLLALPLCGCNHANLFSQNSSNPSKNCVLEIVMQKTALNAGDIMAIECPKGENLNNIQWYIENERICKVSFGYVVALRPGTTKIWGKTESGETTKTITITVT